MSVLSYPRIHFQGRCLINPPTANNDADIDEINAVNVTLWPAIAGLSDQAARSLLMSTYSAISPINQNLHTYVKSGWNYFGDSSVRFLDVAVTSVVGVDGELGDDDPIVGKGIRLLGNGRTRPVICDTDPTGISASQMFIGGLSMGDDDLGLTATHDTRAYSRWIVWRNVATYPGEQNFIAAGATWQFSMPGRYLNVAGTDESPVLAELAQAAGAAHGIQVQFCVYLTQPLIPDTTLGTLFQGGFEPANPGEAYVVGTIGVWHAGELRTVPDGRILLMNTGNDYPLNILLGIASARVHPQRRRVTLNLRSAVPEANYDRPPTTKVDLGTLRLGYIPAGGGAPIAFSGPIPYDNDSYLKSGGIVEVPYDPADVSTHDLEDGTLVILSDSYPQQPLFTEEGSTQVVWSDDGAIYFEEQGMNNPDASREISVLVQDRGRPPSQPVVISLWEYQFVLIPPGPQQRATSALTLVAPGSMLNHRIDFPATVTFPAGQSDPIRIRITAIGTGPLTLAFTLDGQPPGGFFPGWATSLCGVRILPNDNYDNIPDEDLTWEFVYNTVFRYYYLIYPAMSKIIPFNNQQVMESRANDLVDRTDPGRWHSTLYMPHTRDLSKGKRELIRRWAATLRGL
jgi:hypothetical protein